MSTTVAPAARPATFEIARQTLRGQLRALVGWAVAFAGIILMYSAIWPSIRGNSQWQRLFDTLPESYRALFTAGGQLDLGTPDGYLGVELLGFVGPALVATYAIVTGGAAIAGEEERGTLEVTLAAPVSRTRVLAERSAALVAGLAALMAVLAAAMWSCSVAFGMGLSLGRIVACVTALGLFGAVTGAATLATGAATGRPGVARAVGALVAVLSYLLNALGQLTSSLRHARPLSPYYQLLGNQPLHNGLAGWRALAVAAVAVLLVVLGGLALRRRDVT